jgi:hypothetical protein
MGTTPIFGFPYPDPSDLVANYPATAQQLAEDVEDAIYARKILQIVRDTDSTSRATTSTSIVDITGLSVNITPQATTSIILLVMQVTVQASWSGNVYRQDGEILITDASNNYLGGTGFGTINMQAWSAGDTRFVSDNILVIGYSAPATTSEVTYKGRFKSFDASATMTVRNDVYTGQLYAIEVSA